MTPEPQPEGKWELCVYHQDPDHSFDWELCRYPDAPFYNCETNREKFLCPFSCASHSSQQSERDMVLNEYYINFEENGGEYTGYLRICTPDGMVHGKEYQFNAPSGHSEPRIAWRESVLYASGLKRPLSENQIALPAKV